MINLINPISWPTNQNWTNNSDQNQISAQHKYQPSVAAFGDGSDQKPYIITSEEDLLRQKYLPKDVEITVNPEEKQIIFSFSSPSEPFAPYRWLVGYWADSFDPVKRESLGWILNRLMINSLKLQRQLP